MSRKFTGRYYKGRKLYKDFEFTAVDNTEGDVYDVSKSPPILLKDIKIIDKCTIQFDSTMKKSPKLKRYYLKPLKENKVFKGWIVSGPDINYKSFVSKVWTIRLLAIRIRKSGGGSLRIMLRNGKFQEERTYPKGRDPRRSKG